MGRLARNSLASSVVNSPSTSKSIIAKLALKIKAEMKDISSDAHDSCLRDCVEAVKHFHWDTVWLDLLQKMPTLMSLLSRGGSREGSTSVVRAPPFTFFFFSLMGAIWTSKATTAVRSPNDYSSGAVVLKSSRVLNSN